MGSVTGHVFCADTQQPARLAHVVLQPLVDLQSPLLAKDRDAYKPEGMFHLQTVGLDGSFVVPSVPAGLYYVIAEQEGYVSPLALFTREQLNKPDDAMMRRIARYMTAISVTPGHTTQTEVRLIRGASIAGTVKFEDGSPAVGVGVALMTKDAADKWKQVRTGQLASRSSDHTDDQGAFRFTGLPAGSYAVRASVELNNVILDHIFAQHGATSYGDGYHLQIYPGDVFRLKDTKPVKVEEGEIAAGVDIDVPLSRLHSLSGVVLRPGGASPANGATLTLQFADTGDELTSTEVATDDGTFRFDFIPEGTYTLRATRVADVQRTEVPMCPPPSQCTPPTRTETHVLRSFGDASMPLTVTGDQSGVLLHAEPAGKPAH